MNVRLLFGLLLLFSFSGAEATRFSLWRGKGSYNSLPKRPFSSFSEIKAHTFQRAWLLNSPSICTKYREPVWKELRQAFPKSLLEMFFFNKEVQKRFIEWYDSYLGRIQENPTLDKEYIKSSLVDDFRFEAIIKALNGIEPGLIEHPFKKDKITCSLAVLLAVFLNNEHCYGRDYAKQHMKELFEKWYWYEKTFSNSIEASCNEMQKCPSCVNGHCSRELLDQLD